ncbi:tRNA (adenosine(37)-N6)-dimethylallyltransferase MiaA [Micrococcus endophyticus]|uniref:tRNA (adenosine(37)-N6)-dimethylallyltransferase MiaA n=1 Tax=Micrococcus endophyticus TaxID=455343 RepID=UPI0020044F4E|nr:tRNA (adenosine(37)-N6)-dimethylallyltransferase MiaA [Micrococcus endophyticus]MCK6090589.1 tRNA (adenosine(37)-N6)-dimethylallyltransferase MiaA [Micrococcus endophyticus]
MRAARPPVVAVVGATATGKSALAVALAHALDGEVVNGDALQFYRGMDIGTAKVTEDEREGVPHHLLDVLDVGQEASVAAFQSAARGVFEDVRSRGRTPILVGGSGLYVRAALDVLEFPPTDPEVRAAVEAELAERGEAALRAELAAVDPESAAKVADARRLVRALEVHRITGRPFSAFMPRREHDPSVAPVVQIGLSLERAVLHERIEARVERMLAAGLLDEARALDVPGPDGLRQGPTSSRAIGYAQMLAVLDGTLTPEQAAEQTVVATRRFARRQETWFRTDPRVHWVDALAPDVVAQALAVVAGS